MAKIVQQLKAAVSKALQGFAIIKAGYQDGPDRSADLRTAANISGSSKKVIIWGHKLHSHTHSYIHSSYFKAFKRMGYDVYWFDDKDKLSDFNFENCIFLTEAQVDGNIPLNKSSFYILHNCKPQKYLENGCRYLNLCNYVNDCRLGKSFNFPGGRVEKLTYYSYYDVENKALYQPWGTELFPEEISEQPIPYDAKKRDIFYVGTKTKENKRSIELFAKACSDNGKRFVLKKCVSDEESRKLVCRSYIAPDIRDDFHVKVGYIPCRVFKNISYGAIPATNSAFVRDFFDNDVLPYAESTYDLFKTNESYLLNKYNADKNKWLMNEIKEHHTYITRVETILSVMERI